MLIGEKKIFILPGGEYDVILQGYDDGKATITWIESGDNGEGGISIHKFNSFDVSSDFFASINLANHQDEIIMEIDSDSNGLFDSNIFFQPSRF